MKTTGFLITLIGVCSGTTIFPALVKRPLFKAVWHLILLTLICGLVNVSLRLHPFNKAFEECCSNLSNRFGKIEYTDQGMVPSRLPQEPRSASSDNFRVDYLTDQEALKTYRPVKEFNRGVVWTPRSIMIWFKYFEGEEWSIFPILLPTTEFKSFSEMYGLYQKATKDGAASPPFYVMSEMYDIKPLERLGTTPIAFREFKTNVLMGIETSIPTLFSFFLFAYIFFNMLVVSPIYLLFFTSFSFLFGRSNMLKLKFSELFIAGIYTGFPGFIIATLFIALNLPILNFQTIFLISYFIYSFAVFSRLRWDNNDQDKEPKKTTTIEF